MPDTAKLGLQALCLPALSSESIADLPNTLLWEQKMGALPCVGRGWKPTGRGLPQAWRPPPARGCSGPHPRRRKKREAVGAPSCLSADTSALLPRQISHPLLCIPAMEEETGLEGSSLPSYAAGRGRGAEPGGCWGLLCGPLCRPSWPPEHLRLRHQGSVFSPGAWSIGRDVAQFSKDRSGFRAWPPLTDSGIKDAF